MRGAPEYIRILKFQDHAHDCRKRTSAETRPGKVLCASDMYAQGLHVTGVVCTDQEQCLALCKDDKVVTRQTRLARM